MGFLSNEISRPIFRAVLKFKKNSPQIMFAGGVAGVIATTVLACRATLKLSDTLPEMQQKLEDTETKSEAKRVRLENAFTTVSFYAPAVAVGAVSIGALTGAHVQLTRRNAAVTAAYAAVAKAYHDYRERIQNEIGEEREQDLYSNVHLVPVKDELSPDDKLLGSIKKNNVVVSPLGMSPYARFFDQGSRNWQKRADFNLAFLRCQQDWMNEELQNRGHVFLNEVYDSLDIPRSSAGAVVGWVLGPDGDNFVDFGLYNPRNSDFIAGLEPVVLLDFNVDGVVYDLI